MLLSFIATTWLLAMLPGVGQALMLRQTLTAGPRVAVATILGTATGLVGWSVAAGAGLSAAVLAYPAAYQALLFFGGAVLAVLGAKTLWATSRNRYPSRPSHTHASPDLGGPVLIRRRTAYLTGLATNLGNPKAGLFAISLLPAFAGVGRFLPTVGLGVVWAAVTTAWYLLFVTLVSRGGDFITRPSAQRALGYVSGVVLVTVGIGVAAGL